MEIRGDISVASGSFSVGATVEGSNTVTAENWEQNGFPNQTDQTISFVDGTRTFSIQPTGDSFDYIAEGIKHTSTGDTVVIDDVEGAHVIYYDGDTLTSLSNPNAYNVGIIIRTKTIVSLLYWNATDKELIYLGEERHGHSMSPSVHHYLHFTEGLRYLSGLGLNTITADGDGDIDSSAQFGIDAGGVCDEDIYHSPDAVVSSGGLPVYYMLGSGAAPRWVRHQPSGFTAVRYDEASLLAYNQYTGGSWQLTEVSNLDYVLIHVFVTTEKDNPLLALLGQEVYATVGAARAGATTEIRSLLTNSILFPEIRAIATVIFQTSTGYDNEVKARIVTTDDGDDYVDWRSETVSRVAISSSDHESLAGLQGGTTGEHYHLTDSEHTETLALPLVSGVLRADIAPGVFDEFNTVIGSGSLIALTTGKYNAGIGTSIFSELTTANNNVAMGYQALKIGVGNSNVGIGYQALVANSGGLYNTGIGYKTLCNNTTGYKNIAIGVAALQENISGSNNIAIGDSALEDSIGGRNNLAVGTNALHDHAGVSNYNIALGFNAVGDGTCSGECNIVMGSNAGCYINDGDNNIALGCESMYGYNAARMTGDDNIGMGYRTLYNNTTGLKNIAIGREALKDNTTGTHNIAHGDIALSDNVDGIGNVAMGSSAVHFNGGDYNIGVGFEALRGVSGNTGENNIALGYRSLYVMDGGDHNIALGENAGDTVATGNNNICIGQNADVSVGTLSNAMAIGQDAVASGANTLRLGNASTEVQCENLAVYGGINIPSGAPASSSATGTTGEMMWDNEFVYVCIGTNIWKRTQIATW